MVSVKYSKATEKCDHTKGFYEVKSLYTWGGTVVGCDLGNEEKVGACHGSHGTTIESYH